MFLNQGRVNEVIKRGKWLGTDPNAPEILARDKAMDRLKLRAQARREARTQPKPDIRRTPVERLPAEARPARPLPKLTSAKPRIISAQLAFLDL